MFANGAIPSDEEYTRFYDKVNDTPGCAFYTHKTHSNYRTRLRRKAAKRRSKRDDADAVERGTDTGTAQQGASRRVDHVPPSILSSNSDASMSTHASGAPRHDGLLDDAMVAQLTHAAAMHDPDMHARTHAAVAQIVQWADVLGVPALDLFSLCHGRCTSDRVSTVSGPFLSTTWGVCSRRLLRFS